MAEHAGSASTPDGELAARTDRPVRPSPDRGAACETAELSMMTFEAPWLAIELANTASGLVGQLVPPEAGTVWLRTATGCTDPVEVDQCGCFAVAVRPAEPYQLVCRTATGLRVITEWIHP